MSSPKEYVNSTIFRLLPALAAGGLKRLGRALLGGGVRDAAVADLVARIAPIHERLDPVKQHAMLVLVDLVEDRVDQRFRQEMRLEAKVNELGVLGVVVVGFGLDPRVGNMADFDLDALVFARLLDQFGEFGNDELFGELVEYSILPGLGRIFQRELDASHRVADVQIAAGLTTLAVNGQRMPDRGLDAEAVEHRAPDAVVVEAGCEPLVDQRLVGLNAVHDALVQVGRPQSPYFADEMDVVGVMDLREMVEGPGLLGIREHVGAPVVGDLDEAFLDVDVRRPVLTHRAELHEMDIGTVLLDRVEQVEVADKVVYLCEHRVAPIDHRKRRAALFAVMNDRVGPEFSDYGIDEGVVGEVADRGFDDEAGRLLPYRDPFLQRADRDEGIGSAFEVPRAAREIVHDADIVPPLRQVHRLGPSEVSVPSCHNHPHVKDLL